MLKIHKPFSKHKLFLISITSICIVTGLLGFYYLTYTPELSHAESVTSKKTLADIEYMQDVTADICTNTPEADTAGNYQYQLKDSRDQKTYWVAKLKDGNCWMTQNLDLDLYNTTLKVADSDVLNTWQSTTGQSGTWASTYLEPNVAKYYDPGNKYCVYFKIGSGDCDLTSTRNNGHDSQGNYYSWMAATAESGISVTNPGDKAQNSICPKGWKLPLSGQTYNDISGSFYNLLNAYGLTSGVENSVNGYTMYSAPLYFTFAGYAMAEAGYSFPNSPGGITAYWSSIPNGNRNAYMLIFGNTEPSSSWGNYYRYLGITVRCVAMSEESELNDNISIIVAPTISLDVTNEVEVKKSDTNPSTAAFSALVASNQPYSVSISSANPNMTSSTSSTTIPSKSGTLTSNDNAWGIKLSTASTYEQITTAPKLFYSSSSPESKTIPFTIGISTTPDIPNGEYSTHITITATQN